jgi:cephalosporin-C deacetylase-like acetyl esterase
MDEFFDDIKDLFWKNERKEELRQLASEAGFHFRSKERFADQAYPLKVFQVFKGKQSKRIKGIMSRPEKTLELKSRIYDYFYFGHARKRKTTVIELFASDLELYPFEIRPKRTTKWVKDLFVDGDRLFPDQKSFHAKYEIDSDDKEELRYILNEEFLDLIATREELWVEGAGNYLLIYFRYNLIPTHLVLDEYAFSLRLFDRLINGISGEEFV